jgi:hypothetical protein
MYLPVLILLLLHGGSPGRRVSFNQLARLIESIGYAGKQEDYTIKPLQRGLFLVAGISQHTSSRVSSSETTTLSPHAKAYSPSKNASRTRLQHGTAGRALIHCERVRV